MMMESILILVLIIVIILVVTIVSLKYIGWGSTLLFFLLFGLSMGLQLIDGMVLSMINGDFSYLFDALTNPIANMDLNFSTNPYYGLVKLFLWFVLFLMVSGILAKGLKKTYPQLKENKYFKLFFPIGTTLVLLYGLGLGLPNFNLYMIKLAVTNPILFISIIVIIILIMFLYLKYADEKVTEGKVFKGKHNKFYNVTVQKNVLNIFNQLQMVSNEYVKTIHNMAKCIDDFSVVEWFDQRELYDFLRDHNVKRKDIINEIKYLIIRKLNVEVYKTPRKYALLFVNIRLDEIEE